LRPTRAIISLPAIRHNLRQVRCGLPASTRIIAVVKANAYGHGAVPVSTALLEAGADWLAVAIPEEGAALRDAGFRVPILVLGLSLPEQAELFTENDLTATVASPEALQALQDAAAKQNRRSRVMVKIDTGMGRIGLQTPEAVPFVLHALSLTHIEVVGLFTHFSAADEPDKSFALTQLSRLEELVRTLGDRGITLAVISAANSAATDSLPEACLNAVRPGIILYGLPPAPEMPLRLDLKPAMSLVTRIVHLKQVPAGTPVSYGCTYHTPAPTWLATLPVGYADGYSRHLSNRAEVLIHGIRRRVVGRICMDQTVVDIGPDCDVAVGDEAVLVGRQSGEEITLTELADLAGTISYELACLISPRVPRVYED
jgi:alanine racemase